MTDMQAPDGIAEEHVRDHGRASPVPLLFLVALLGLGLAGFLGGQPDEVRQARSEAVSLSVQTPCVLRNGMVFETIVEVVPKRPVADLVIGVSAPLWREMTINTMIPAAEEESHKDGNHRFSFGSAEPGETFRFKIDGQINPPLFAGTHGEIAAYDGDHKLAGVPVAIRVLP
jgi:hypothetical protein